MENKHNQVHTIQNGNSEYKIASLLPVGKENAISSRELAKIIGCKTVRELQERIADERRQGAIICSRSIGGYFVPANREEMEEFYKTLENRAKNTFVALRSVRRAMKIPEGQQFIETEVNEHEK